MENGDLVSVGMTHDVSDAGYLIKTNRLGEVIWQREYDYNNSTDLFYTMFLTSDGGFLLGGQSWNYSTNNQEAWLLKVDSLGCPYPNCVVGTGVDEYNTIAIVADIYPNPASDLLNIEFQNEDDWVVTLTDVNGKVVYETTDHGRRTTVNTSIFSNGVYLLQLVSGGSVVNKKIVVQH